MKNLTLSLTLLFINISVFAQEKVDTPNQAALVKNECKCFTKTVKTYEIIGEITFEEGQSKFYAGVKDSLVYFTEVEYKGEVVYSIIQQTIPIQYISLIFNDPLKSRTKKEQKTGYTALTLGFEFGDKRKLAISHTATCHMPTPSSGSYQRAKLIIKGRFLDPSKIEKLMREIKIFQGS